MWGSERLAQANLWVKHRNQLGWHQNRSLLSAPGAAWKVPTYWPCGVRCRAGVSLIAGFRAELENLVGSVKGKGTSGRTVRLKVPMGQSGADCSVVPMKRRNGRGGKGAGHLRWDRKGQRATGGTQWS